MPKAQFRHQLQEPHLPARLPEGELGPPRLVEAQKRKGQASALPDA